jgi:hypothetical protein
MQDRLPRELRHIINVYLWNDTKSEELLHLSQRDWSVSRSSLLLKLWLDPVCVELATAVESAEMIYRSVAHLYAEAPEMITRLLCEDAFHLGFQSLTVITNFTIKINIDDCLRVQAPINRG